MRNFKEFAKKNTRLDKTVQQGGVCNQRTEEIIRESAVKF